MERALKQWMYAVRKENSYKHKFSAKNKIDSIDEAFTSMGVYLSQGFKETCVKK